MPSCYVRAVWLTRSAYPDQKSGWCVVDSLSISGEKEGKFAVILYQMRHWRSCVVIFTQFVSTATIASPHSALRKTR
ncbi:hypothetical protein KCP74_05495 [Salmonella enterica subsp. enterica]|nr:hypothetical protein KCP74_05495 [Salmonella enterica subsp. enterica]